MYSVVNESKKRNITLTVDGETIEKAKQSGLNISEITESHLRHYTFTPEELQGTSLTESYWALFDSMTPLLNDYMTGVEVGEIEIRFSSFTTKEKIWLGSNGVIFFQWDGDVHEITELKSTDLYDPGVIVSNFVRSLAEASEKRKERIGELKMAKSIVEAIADSLKSSK